MKDNRPNKAKERLEASFTGSRMRRELSTIEVKREVKYDRKGKPIMVYHMLAQPAPDRMRAPTGCQERARRTTNPGTEARRRAMQECRA